MMVFREIDLKHHRLVIKIVINKLSLEATVSSAIKEQFEAAKQKFSE